MKGLHMCLRNSQFFGNQSFTDVFKKSSIGIFYEPLQFSHVQINGDSFIYYHLIKTEVSQSISSRNIPLLKYI